MAVISLNVDFSTRSRLAMKNLGYEPVSNFAAYQIDNYKGLLDLYYVELGELNTIKNLLDEENIPYL